MVLFLFILTTLDHFFSKQLSNASVIERIAMISDTACMHGGLYRPVAVARSPSHRTETRSDRSWSFRFQIRDIGGGWWGGGVGGGRCFGGR